ncbi:NAD-dependent epimerase/dehydratase family protein [Alphaproteobacteria bacterium]|nr:NAD-dependent epimerase/dehydratase family protein [Alphaproteobacteria bacterium]
MSDLMLLTGASGFIGSSFLVRALESGWHVRVLARGKHKWMPNANIEFSYGDFETTTDWTRAVQGVDVVVHAAAEIKDPVLMPFVNVLGPKRLLQAAVNSGVKRWVQLSSVGGYGPVQSGLVSEDWPDKPSGPYEVSKTDFDEILKQAAQDHGIQVCIVRPSNIYGPGMQNKSIQHLLNAIRKNLFVFIGPEGASANYVHVQDVVQALDLCVRHPNAANQTYIVSAWSTMESMVSGLAAGAELGTPSYRIPLTVATLFAKGMQWLPRWPLTQSRVQAMSVRSRYSTDKIEKELGWKLTVPVTEGMREFAQDLHK